MKYSLILLHILLVDRSSGLKDLSTLSGALNRSDDLRSPLNTLTKNDDGGSNAPVFLLHKNDEAIAKTKTKRDKTNSATEAPSSVQELSYKVYSAYLDNNQVKKKSRKKREYSLVGNFMNIDYGNDNDLDEIIDRTKRGVAVSDELNEGKNFPLLEFDLEKSFGSGKDFIRNQVRIGNRERRAANDGVDAGGGVSSDGNMNGELDSPAGSSSVNSTAGNNKRRGNKRRGNDGTNGNRRGGKRRGNKKNQGKRKPGNGNNREADTMGKSTDQGNPDMKGMNGENMAENRRNQMPNRPNNPNEGGPQNNGMGSAPPRSESGSGPSGGRMDDSSTNRESSEEGPRGNPGWSVGGGYQNQMGGGSAGMSSDGVQAQMDYARP